LLQEFTPDKANDTFPLWKRGIEGDFSVESASEIPMPPLSKGGKSIFMAKG
jgi:hypothetical protein